MSQIYQCIRYYSFKKVWERAILGQACFNYIFCCSVARGINWGPCRKQRRAYLCNSAWKELCCQGTRINTVLSKIFYSDSILRRSVALTLPQGDHSLKRNCTPRNNKELLGNCSVPIKSLNGTYVITVNYLIIPFPLLI